MMNIDLEKLDVVPYPHPALRWVAKPIPKVTSLIQDVAKRMIELMHQYKGIGLAATQVALPWRMFVTCVNNKELVFINPEVHPGRRKNDKNFRVVLDFEACLSLPGLEVGEQVLRSKDVYIEALDIDGKPFVISGSGMLARVIHHEHDHLLGKLFIDHLKLTSKIQRGDQIITLKEHVDDWLDYLKAQYEYLTPPKSQKPKYGTDEEEKEKLVKLEELLLNMV